MGPELLWSFWLVWIDVRIVDALSNDDSNDSIVLCLDFLGGANWVAVVVAVIQVGCQLRHGPGRVGFLGLVEVQELCEPKNDGGAIALVSVYH